MTGRIISILNKNSDNPFLDRMLERLTDDGVRLTIIGEKTVKEDGKNIDILGIDDVDAESLRGGLLLTSMSTLGLALSMTRDCPETRICIYMDTEEGLKDLLRYGRLSKFDSDVLGNKLKEFKDSVVFLNGESFSVFAKNVRAFQDVEPRYLPALLPEIPKMPAFPDIVDSNEINIAWIGPIFSSVHLAIQGICKDLVKTERDRRITIHMIGPGRDSTDFEFIEYSPKIRFVFVGNLTGKHRSEYVSENTDLIIAYRNEALTNCDLGVPVYSIPVFTEYDGKMSLVSDIKDYNYAAKRHLQSEREVTIDDILSDIYEKGRKKELARACFDYACSNAQDDAWSKRLVELLDGSTVTSADLLSVPFLRKTADRFQRAFRRKDHDYEEAVTALSARNDKVLHMVETDGLSLDDIPAGYVLKAQMKTTYDRAWYHADRFYRFGRHVAWKVCTALYHKRMYSKVQRSYPAKVRRIIEKNAGKKIKVAFLLVFKTSFPMRAVFEKMQDDPDFDPYIIVAPNVSRSHHFRMSLFNDAYGCLSKDYPGRVIAGYDEKTDSYLDLKDDYPIIVFCNPYKHLVNKLHDIDYFLDKDVLGIYANYGYAAVNFWKEVISTEFYNKAWKVCVENEMNYQYLRKEEPIHGRNGVVVGYAKMDHLSLIEKTQKPRKRILICPHHTVWGWKILNISNFLKYSELFVRLPELFPDIDFIFRPHPLLFPNLKEYRIWSEDQIEEYMSRLLDHPNMSYSTTEDYSDEFVQSDAMIHDCASFTAEYLFTDNPCCYMIKSEEETYGTMLPFGKECLSNYYHASDEKDIIDFIQNVVVEGNDPMKEKRSEFVNGKLRVNYPHVAETFIEYLKKELKR